MLFIKHNYVYWGLSLLIAVQSLALAKQFYGGFWPGVTVPTRVAFSWDMFATRIERCVIACNPAVHIGSRLIHRHTEMTPLLEWDFVYDDASDYLNFAQILCQHVNVKTQIILTCFAPPHQTFLKLITCMPT